MAAWGSLLNIFENRSDSLSSWSQLLPKPDESDAATSTSFDMFGDLCHVTPSSPIRAPPRFDKSSSWNATMSEPDNDAFEIFGELFYKSKNNGTTINEEDWTNSSKTVGPQQYKRSYSDVRARHSNGGLMVPPPPITSIGKGGKPRVYFKSYRKDGRFVLREMRIPTQQLLQSSRENGRLRMRVAVAEEDEEQQNVSLSGYRSEDVERRKD